MNFFHELSTKKQEYNFRLKNKKNEILYRLIDHTNIPTDDFKTDDSIYMKKK